MKRYPAGELALSGVRRGDGSDGRGRVQHEGDHALQDRRDCGGRESV